MKKLRKVVDQSKKLEEKPSSNVKREIKLKKELKGRVFDRVKFNGVIYAVGDSVEVRIRPSNLTSLARIVKIIDSNCHSKYSYWPMIEVEWLYKKQEIEGLGIKEDLSYVGNFEVFLSNHKDDIFIESILRKVSLIKLEDYQSLEVLNEGIYYTRGRVDTIKVSKPILYSLRNT